MPGWLRMAGLAQIAAIDRLDQRVGAVAARNTDEFVALGLEPVVIFLRRGRADVEEIGEAADLPQQLEELRLPVFERVAAHLDQIARDLGRDAVLQVLIALQIGITAFWAIGCESVSLLDV